MANNKVTVIKTFEESTAYIKQQLKNNEPKIMIICGTGLGTLADTLTDKIIINYKDIPHYPTTTIQGHKSQLVAGKLNGVWVLCALGRFHFYEGNDMDIVVYPVRIVYQHVFELVQ